MKKTLIALAIGHALTHATYANDTSTTQNPNTSYNVVLPDMFVTLDAPFSQQIGTQKLTATDIASTPKANGNITELLKDNPSVQFDNLADSSLLGGELEPSRVSFYGEKYYNNNFMIDGLSNNNNIDPASNNAIAGGLPTGYNAWDLPAGGEQSLWIDSSLIDNLEVFDSNISAKYGDFTGGVIDAKIKNPSRERTSGHISYRTTSDKLSEFHIDPKIQDNFESASRLDYQPIFTKHFYSASINQPLSDKASVLLSYNRQQSTIPTYQDQMAQWRDQERLNETYLLKGIYHADNGDTWTATAMYAPHSSKFFRRNIKDSSYTNQGGGYRFNIDHKHKAKFGDISTKVAYQHDENSIENEADHYYPWWHKNQNRTSKVIDWQSGALTKAGNQTALYGGYGKYATDKKSLSVKQDYTFKPLTTGTINHKISAGWEYRHEQSDYQRFHDTTLAGTTLWNPKVVCQAKDDGCITGEQYTSIRLFYPIRSTQAKANKYALYAQNHMDIGKVELTGGVRATYDDFSKRFNLSPRFSFTADVFDNKATRLFGGWNRYYANNIYAYKLKNGISSYEQQTRTIDKDGILSEWKTQGNVRERSSSKYNYDPSHLKTPYSNEVNLGLAQQIGDSLWTLKWVNRHSKRSFARSQTRNEAGEQIMDNSGWSKSDAITLSVQPKTPISYDGLDLTWDLGASWSKNRQNTANTYYDESELDEQKVIYDGKLIRRDELPAFNFNKPWQAFANVKLNFPGINFDWHHRFGYTAGYTAYDTSLKDCPNYDTAICGDHAGRVTLYQERKFKNHFSYDWHFNYKKPLSNHQSLEFAVDVNNVLNTKSVASVATGGTTYKMGRNIWLSASYRW